MDPARESLPVGDETFLFVEGLPLGDSLAHNGDLFGCTHNGDFFDSAHNGDLFNSTLNGDLFAFLEIVFYISPFEG